MNARDLHDEFRDANALDRDALVRQHSATILRALSLLAAVEESDDGLVRELRCMAADAIPESGIEQIADKAAARIVGLEQELASLKAHADAMANDLEVWDNHKLDKSWQAYRAAHPRTP